MWNHFDIVKAFKYVCEGKNISSKPVPTIFRDYFYVEGSIFASTITAFGAIASQLKSIPFNFRIVRFLMFAILSDVKKRNEIIRH